MKFEEIEAVTVSILEEIQELLGKIGPPVPVDQTASKLFQLKVEKAELPQGQAGRLILETQTIQVNSKDKVERRRFTISHELGHYCLHRKILMRASNISTDSTSKKHFGSRIETEANTFAAYLLMPRRMIYAFFIKALMETTQEDLNWLLKILNHLPNSNIISLNSLISNYAISNHRNIDLKQQFLPSIIPRIALKFAVSPDAITWRLKNLKILSHFVTKEIYDSF